MICVLRAAQSSQFTAAQGSAISGARIRQALADKGSPNGPALSSVSSMNATSIDSGLAAMTGRMTLARILRVPAAHDRVESDCLHGGHAAAPADAADHLRSRAAALVIRPAL
jgi:hypothetical protein